MNIEDLSKLTAKSLDLHPNLVEEINRIQWKFLHKEMQSKDWLPINIFYIGKFSRKKNRAENRKILNAKIQRDLNESSTRNFSRIQELNISKSEDRGDSREEIKDMF